VTRSLLAESLARRDLVLNMKVLTYNIHRGANVNDKYDLNRIIDVVRTSGADICGLQELDNKYHERSNFEDQLEIMAKALSMNKIGGPCIIPDENDESVWYGNGILSRFPIVESYVHRMYMGDDQKIKYDGTRETEPRSFIQAKVDLGEGKYLWTIITHLSFHSSDERMRQVKKLEEAVMEVKGPLILMGDLNSEPQSEELTVLRKLLDDPSMGKKFVTEPVGKVQIDYILTREVKVEEIKVIDTDASDHFPLFAKLRIE